jgi:hypothetical protein
MVKTFLPTRPTIWAALALGACLPSLTDLSGGSPASDAGLPADAPPASPDARVPPELDAGPQDATTDVADLDAAALDASDASIRYCAARDAAFCDDFDGVNQVRAGQHWTSESVPDGGSISLVSGKEGNGAQRGPVRASAQLYRKLRSASPCKHVLDSNTVGGSRHGRKVRPTGWIVLSRRLRIALLSGDWGVSRAPSC